MNCQYCGAEIYSYVSVCLNCGQPVSPAYAKISQYKQPVEPPFTVAEVASQELGGEEPSYYQTGAPLYQEPTYEAEPTIYRPVPSYHMGTMYPTYYQPSYETMPVYRSDQEYAELLARLRRETVPEAEGEPQTPAPATEMTPRADTKRKRRKKLIVFGAIGTACAILLPLLLQFLLTGHTIFTPPEEPTAKIDIDTTTVNTNDVITFDASKSTDPQNDIRSYFWDFGDGTQAEGETVYHTYSDNGVYTVTLTVEDAAGHTATAAIEITVNNVAPIVDFYVGDSEVKTIDDVEFFADCEDTDGYIIRYEWDLDGDGSYEVDSETYKDQIYSYSDDGIYNVKLKVTDDDYDFTVATVQVTVLNRPPTINLSMDILEAYTLTNLTFEVSASDIDGTIHNYYWDFNGDGEHELVTKEPVAIYTYQDDGVYEVMVTAEDDDNAVSTDSATIRINNRHPEVEVNANKSAVYTNDEIKFNVTATDLDGEILLFEWDFEDDGIIDWSSETTGTTVYSYSDDGNYRALLQVKDDDNAITLAYVSVIVMNRAPVATAHASPLEVTTLTDITFEAFAMDPDGTIVKYEWDFDGDGYYEWESTETGTTTHAYEDNGIYVAALRVTDDDGATSVDTVELVVNNRPPTCTIQLDSYESYTGFAFHFDAVVEDLDGHIIYCEWDFDGDGIFDYGWSTPETTHVYEIADTYEVTLRVRDNDDATATDSTTITIYLNHPPVADAGEDQSGSPGDTIAFDGSGSYDPDGHELTYHWDFGDGGVGEGIFTSHTYTIPNTYTVTLTVSDGALEATDTVIVSIISLKYALVVGTNAGGLQNCENDALDWQGYLEVHDYEVTVLLTSQATKSNVLNALAEIEELEGPGGYFVFVYSGHGYYSNGHSEMSSIDMWDYELKDAVANFESTYMFFFFDCCHAGHFDDELAGDGRFIVTACSIYETTGDWPYDGSHANGAFTAHFLEDGLKGGYDSAEEAFNYAYNVCTTYEGTHPECYDWDPGSSFYF
jgi:PKD repeat protein